MEPCKTCDAFLNGQCRRRAPVELAVTEYDGFGGQRVVTQSLWPVPFDALGCGEHRPADAPERWAIVEVMGHQRIAGRISVDYSTGHALTRIDVPEVVVAVGRWQTDAKGERQRMISHYPIPDHVGPLLGKGAIFAVQDVDRETALAEAAIVEHRPKGFVPPYRETLVWTVDEDEVE